METLVLETPIGPVHITANETVIQQITIGEGPSETRETPLLRHAAEQLRAYFAGTARTFDLPLVPSGPRGRSPLRVKPPQQDDTILSRRYSADSLTGKRKAGDHTNA